MSYTKEQLANQDRVYQHATGAQVYVDCGTDGLTSREFLPSIKDLHNYARKWGQVEVLLYRCDEALQKQLEDKLMQTSRTLKPDVRRIKDPGELRIRFIPQLPDPDKTTNGDVEVFPQQRVQLLREIDKRIRECGFTIKQGPDLTPMVDGPGLAL